MKLPGWDANPLYRQEDRVCRIAAMLRYKWTPRHARFLGFLYLCLPSLIPCRLRNEVGLFSLDEEQWYMTMCK
jgi:hypothetical protein